MSTILALQLRDPVIARDGRPFGANSGSRMSSLSWPLPSTVTGSIRTLIGNQLSGNFTPELIEDLKAIACHGPLPVSDDQLFLPAPEDGLMNQPGECITLRPDLAASQFVDLPSALCPVLPNKEVSIGKFPPQPAWWSMKRMTDWLLLEDDAPASFFQDSSQFRLNPEQDQRTHVKITPETQASEDGMLFSTIGLVLDQLPVPKHELNSSTPETSLAVRIKIADDSRVSKVSGLLNHLQPTGGERRLVNIAAETQSSNLFDVPDFIQKKFQSIDRGSQLRMVLATPAIFSNGWRPGWLDEEDGRVGTPPPLAGTGFKLRLNAVCNQRWDAVSGWSYELRGPKAVRRLVPAGGVYYLTIEDLGTIDREMLAKQLWLHPVSDNKQDCRDGFGLASWGVWKER